jgi:hypothetical protein
MNHRRPGVLCPELDGVPVNLNDGTLARVASPVPQALGGPGSQIGRVAMGAGMAAGQNAAAKLGQRGLGALGRKMGLVKPTAAASTAPAAPDWRTIASQELTTRRGAEDADRMWKTAEALRTQLGLTEAERPMKGLVTVIEFFTDELGQDPLSWVNYLKGIDFSNEVLVKELMPGIGLSQHQAVDARPKPFAYYTEPGTSPTRTGTTFETSQYRLFRVKLPTKALVSKASAMSFNDPEGKKLDPVSRMGGGRQYIISARKEPELVREGDVRTLDSRGRG